MLQVVIVIVERIRALSHGVGKVYALFGHVDGDYLGKVLTVEADPRMISIGARVTCLTCSSNRDFKVIDTAE